MEYNTFKAGIYKIDNYSGTIFAAKFVPYLTYLPPYEDAIIYSNSVPSSGGVTTCSLKDFLLLNPVFIGEYKRA